MSEAGDMLESGGTAEPGGTAPDRARRRIEGEFLLAMRRAGAWRAGIHPRCAGERDPARCRRAPRRRRVRACLRLRS